MYFSSGDRNMCFLAEFIVDQSNNLGIHGGVNVRDLEVVNMP